MMSNIEENLARFKIFLDFISKALQDPNLLDGLDIPSNKKQGLLSYYNDDLFGANQRRIQTKHVKWFARLIPIFELPPNSVVLDFGGGFGLDAIFLASCGYKVILLDLFPHKLLICQHLVNRWRDEIGDIEVRTVLSDDADARLGVIDGVLLKEVAHHIEPPSEAFEKCRELMSVGSKLFLLEPNFFNPLVQAFFLRVRGFKIKSLEFNEDRGIYILFGNENIRPIFLWDRIVQKSGLVLDKRSYVCGHFLSDMSSLNSKWIKLAESLPIIRDLLASHITSEYIKKTP